MTVSPPLAPAASICGARSSDGCGSIAVMRDAEARFRVTGIGTWTADYADDHFGMLDAALTAARRPSLTLRVLVDLRLAAVQPPETAQRIAVWTRQLYRAEDRVAIVVASSLVKMQMRRVAMIATRELFLSESAALTWLAA